MHRPANLQQIHQPSHPVRGAFPQEDAILTSCSIPETFDVVSKTVDVQSRKNLARISEVLTQIASGVPFDEDSPNHLPINDYVNRAIGQMSAWFLEGERRLVGFIVASDAFSSGERP